MMTVLSVGYLKHIWRSEDLVVLAHVPETPHLANISFKRELRGTFIACPRANAERDIVIAFMSVRPSAVCHTPALCQNGLINMILSPPAVTFSQNQGLSQN